MAREHHLGDVVLAGVVGLHNGGNQVLRHITEVGPQLLGVLGQAVATVAKGGIVVLAANPGVKTDPLDDGSGVQAPHLCVGVQLVEVGHPQGKVGVGKKLYCLSLSTVHKQGGNIFF